MEERVAVVADAPLGNVHPEVEQREEPYFATADGLGQHGRAPCEERTERLIQGEGDRQPFGHDVTAALDVQWVVGVGVVGDAHLAREPLRARASHGRSFLHAHCTCTILHNGSGSAV